MSPASISLFTAPDFCASGEPGAAPRRFAAGTCVAAEEMLVAAQRMPLTAGETSVAQGTTRATDALAVEETEGALAAYGDACGERRRT
jgi:hypothetical protein